MEVNSSLSTGAVTPAVPGRVAAPPAANSKPSVSFGEAQALDEALEQLPQSRPEVITFAKDMIGDVTYPPREMINRISILLAMHFTGEQE